MVLTHVLELFPCKKQLWLPFGNTSGVENINRLLIPHKHRRYSCIAKYGDAIAFYNHHSKYIYLNVK